LRQGKHKHHKGTKDTEGSSSRIVLEIAVAGISERAFVGSFEEFRFRAHKTFFWKVALAISRISSVSDPSASFVPLW